LEFHSAFIFVPGYSLFQSGRAGLDFHAKAKTACIASRQIRDGILTFAGQKKRRFIQMPIPEAIGAITRFSSAGLSLTE